MGGYENPKNQILVSLIMFNFNMKCDVESQIKVFY
jgi:hypothetical protein